MAKVVKKTNSATTKKTETKAKTAVVAAEKNAPKIKKRDLSDVNPEYTDAFIREVDEDVKNDNLKVLWKKYGALIVSFVIIAVSAAVCFDQIKIWKMHQNQARTEAYMTAAQEQSSPEKTIAALKKIEQSSNGIFGDFARLQIANILLEQGKTQEALTQLQAIIGDKQVNSEVKNIALIKFATYKVDEMEQKEFAQLLQPIFEENSSWVPMANDLLAMSAIKAGDMETAKRLYKQILQTNELPEGFKTEIQEMLSSISDM